MKLESMIGQRSTFIALRNKATAEFKNFITEAGGLPSESYAVELGERIDELTVYIDELDEAIRIAETPVKIGRPAIGVTKKVSLTLPEDHWDFVESVMSDQGMTQGAALRYIVELGKQNVDDYMKEV